MMATNCYSKLEANVTEQSTNSCFVDETRHLCGDGVTSAAEQCDVNKCVTPAAGTTRKAASNSALVTQKQRIRPGSLRRSKFLAFVVNC